MFSRGPSGRPRSKVRRAEMRPPLQAPLTRLRSAHLSLRPSAGAGRGRAENCRVRRSCTPRRALGGCVGARSAARGWLAWRVLPFLRLARLPGLYPADPVEAAAQEMVQQAANDVENVEPIFNGFTKEVRRLATHSALAHGSSCACVRGAAAPPLVLTRVSRRVGRAAA